MRKIESLFSKKKEVSNELDMVASVDNGSLEKAEQIANIVSAGLEKGDYSEINQQLSMLSQKNEGKHTFVFEHPNIISRFYAIEICMLISIIFVYFLFIGIATSLLSLEYPSLGLLIAVISAVVFVVNIAFVLKLISTIKFKSRYDVYEELLGYRSFEFIEDIAICSNQNEDVVIKDLQQASKQKLIPQGHFSNENIVFMVSNDVYNRYMEKPAVYDRYFRKIIKERKRIKSRDEKISQLVEAGERYVQKLNGYVLLVKDKGLSRKINRMENIVSMIFHEIDANPNRVQSLGVFLNYYLLTTDKLLEAYVTMDETQVLAKSTTQAYKEIELAINNIVSAFEEILEKLYEEQDMDITSDIAAIELSMKQEGLLD